MGRGAALTALSDAEALRLAAEPFSYPVDEPDRSGYWRYSVSAPIGRGRETFDRAVAGTLGWQIHLRSGIAVAASSPRVSDEPPTVCRIRIPVWLLSFTAVARVVEVIEEADRGGFTYGTLPGHPVWGEESFVVDIDDDVVSLTVVASSRPHAWYARICQPVTRALQLRMARRFLRALI